MRIRVRELAEGCASHPALNNDFYKLWMGRVLTPRQVEVFAENFYARVKNTPDRIALAFLHMTDVTARVETVQNLADEMGMGDPKKAHSVLLRQFFDTLLTRLHGRPANFDSAAAPLLKTTRDLITEGRRVFSSDNPAEACGALLAQEWHAYPQLVYVYEGVRNYMELFGIEEFHECCEYFYLHIGATEKQHKVHSLMTAAQMCRSEDDYRALERGFMTYLNLLADNWDEIHRTVNAS